MSNEQRQKRGLSFVDIVLIIAIIGVIAVALYNVVVTVSGKAGSDDSVTLEYTIKVEKVDTKLYDITVNDDGSITARFLHNNESVIWVEENVNVGTVVNVISAPHMEFTGEHDENGEMIYAEYTGYVDLYITVRVNATKTENGYQCAGCNIVSNNEISFRTQTYTAKGTIQGVSEMEVQNGK